MGNLAYLFKSGNAIPTGLVAIAFLGIITALGLVSTLGPTADIRIEPAEQVIAVNDTFTVQVVVESSIPVNVFAGEVEFSHDVLEVQSIDYNTSVADLWTEEPWYNKGDGKIYFAGGTTQQGGFKGESALMSITFKTLKIGDGRLVTNNAIVLQHDGLGTEADVADPIQSIIRVEGGLDKEEVQLATNEARVYKVVEEVPTTDLNGDGKQTISDISIFMINLASNNAKYDFNLDGKVNIKDLNIILGKN